jgi:hypothetical protein
MKDKAALAFKKELFVFDPTFLVTKNNNFDPIVNMSISKIQFTWDIPLIHNCLTVFKRIHVVCCPSRLPLHDFKQFKHVLSEFIREESIAYHEFGYEETSSVVGVITTLDYFLRYYGFKPPIGFKYQQCADGVMVARSVNNYINEASRWVCENPNLVSLRFMDKITCQKFMKKYDIDMSIKKTMPQLLEIMRKKAVW